MKIERTIYIDGSLSKYKDGSVLVAHEEDKKEVLLEFKRKTDDFRPRAKHRVTKKSVFTTLIISDEAALSLYIGLHDVLKTKGLIK